jgi:hypothetical protein
MEAAQKIKIDRRRLKATGPSSSFFVRLALGTEIWDEVLAPVGIKLDPWQREVVSTPSKRILLCCSRQAGKSTVGSILALKTALLLPRQLIILVSPSLRQSSELFRKVISILDLLPIKPQVIEQNRLSIRFKNNSRIVSLPCSEGTIRGFSGVSLLIEDEASRVDDAVYKAIRPMLAVSSGRLVLMSTPAGKRGHFWEAWSDEEGWTRYKITAHDCPRISKEFLEEERRALGDLWFRQEYECEFLEAEGQLFRAEDLEAMWYETGTDLGVVEVSSERPFLEVV